MNRPSPLFLAFRHLVLMSGAVIFLAPFIWMLLTSFKPADEIFTKGLSLFPKNWAMVENYTIALTDVPLPRYL